MELGLAGLASGFDWKSLIDQMTEVERVPQLRLLSEQNALEERSTAYGGISTQLNVLKNRLTALQAPGLFSGRTASATDTTAGTASAAAGAIQGTYTFDFQQLASSAKILGTTGAGRALSNDSDVSDVPIETAGFASPVTAGTFRVNGAAVTIATTDTLKGVFDKIAAATGNEVIASYDATTDQIRLNGTGTITLGSATDTSNFLEVAKLHNNGTADVVSAGSLGSVRLSAKVGEANLDEDLIMGTGGAGLFRINGKDIAYSSEDSVATLLKRIGDSDAGVTASYDVITDRFVLANKGTGDVGIALEDVAGNFLEATGLKNGTLDRGKDLLYTVDGGGQLRSRSNTIREASSGLTGLSVTALEEGGSTVVTVGTDREAIRKAITAFVEEYNGIQSAISKETALTLDGKGKATAGTLATEGDAEAIATTLRRMAYGPVEGLSGTLRHLESLGYKSNGDDDTLKLEDETALDDALTNRLGDLESLWLDKDNGIATRMTAYLDRVIGDNGSLEAKSELLKKQAVGIDTQIEELERVVQANRERLTNSFLAMETAQQKFKQQLSFLTQRFGTQ